MRNSTLSPNAVYNLSSCLANPSFYITGLSFKFCFLEFYDVVALGDAIKFNKTLVKLDLSKNALKSISVKMFMEALEDNYCLAHLDLSGNHLDNEFAYDLAKVLEKNQQLHTVDISNNPIEPEGAKQILQTILEHNDTLESLGDLKNTNMLMGVRFREEL